MNKCTFRFRIPPSFLLSEYKVKVNKIDQKTCIRTRLSGLIYVYLTEIIFTLTLYPLKLFISIEKIGLNFQLKCLFIYH